MVYPYECRSCGKQVDIIKPMSECSNIEMCECGVELTRIFLPAHLTGTKLESAEYNPGLGQVTYGKKDREEKARRKGLVEVGNDYGSGEKQQKEFEKKKQDELESKWKDPSNFTL